MGLTVEQIWIDAPSSWTTFHIWTKWQQRPSVHNIVGRIERYREEIITWRRLCRQWKCWKISKHLNVTFHPSRSSVTFHRTLIEAIYNPALLRCSEQEKNFNYQYATNCAMGKFQSWLLLDDMSKNPSCLTFRGVSHVDVLKTWKTKTPFCALIACDFNWKKARRKPVQAHF